MSVQRHRFHNQADEDLTQTLSSGDESSYLNGIIDYHLISPFSVFLRFLKLQPMVPDIAVAGICMMSSHWRDNHHPSVVDFISSFLNVNHFRLTFVPIAPDFIFNCAGSSVAFVFVTRWDTDNALQIFDRVRKLKGKFANLFVVVSLPTKERNEDFVRSYFKIEAGRPTFIPVQDIEMGFEKILKIAHARGACRRNDVTTKMKTERKQAIETIDIYLNVITSIPSITNHDGIALNQTIGSIEAISKATIERILESTDLSHEKAEIISRFFRDPKLYLSPKFN